MPLSLASVLLFTGAKALSGNAYKIQIAKTAVRRAILRAAGMTTV